MRFSCLILCLLLLAACEKDGIYDSIKKDGEIVFLTRNAPTTYYLTRDHVAGLEYDMAKSFALYLGVKPKFTVRNTISELIGGLQDKQGHIIAAGLIETESRATQFLSGPAYQEVSLQVVCHRDGIRPKTIQQLEDINLFTAPDSSYLEALMKIKQKHKDLKWLIAPEEDTEELLERVWKRELDCVVSDSNILAINQRYYPELVASFELDKKKPLVWLVDKKATKLKEQMDLWFEKYQKTQLHQIKQKYFGHIEIFDYVDTKTYKKRIETILPQYRHIFEKVAKRYHFNWTLIAAQSYQESHWDEDAKSPTGVRGMMMLTRRTASELGVEDRVDPEQSIDGGVRYLYRLRQNLAQELQEPDLTWIALAAYNVGLGHVRDAQLLAKRQGLNPTRWSSLVKTLPLLAKKKYYVKLKYGYARGREPVRYVTNIRDYRDILERHLNLTRKKWGSFINEK